MVSVWGNASRNAAARIASRGRQLSRLPAARAVFDQLRQFLDLVICPAVFCHFFADFAVRVHHRGVVFTAELIANLWQ